MCDAAHCNEYPATRSLAHSTANAEHARAEGIVIGEAERGAREPDGGLDGPSTEYLAALMRNIGIMLSYANDSGIALPDDLREKLDKLLNHKDVVRDHVTETPRRKGFLAGLARGWLAP